MSQTWKTFLHTHAKARVAIDFIVVPTATFRVLYVLVILAHERRRVLHFNITDAPSAARLTAWIYTDERMLPVAEAVAKLPLFDAKGVPQTVPHPADGMV